MQDSYKARRLSLGIIVAFSAMLVAVGGCTQKQNSNSNPSSTTTTSESTTSLSTQSVEPSKPTTNKLVQSAREETVKVYWVDDVNNKVEVVPRTISVKSTGKTGELLETAFKSLLAGPTDPAVTTTIPQGTKLRKLDLKPDGVHVDLSQDFTEGGGSTSMTSRVAQVIYTASSLDPSAQVWISVDGKPLEVLGGEGLILDQPITRESFEKNFSL